MQKLEFRVSKALKGPKSKQSKSTRVDQIINNFCNKSAPIQLKNDAKNYKKFTYVKNNNKKNGKKRGKN